MHMKELTLHSRSLAEWDGVSLSEEHMVAALIKARQSLDPVRTQTPCGYRLQETMICLYASLDLLIQRAPLTAHERTVITRYMDGYAADEISEESGVTRQAASKALHSAVRKLTRQNNRDWLEQVSGRYRIQECAKESSV